MKRKSLVALFAITLFVATLNSQNNNRDWTAMGRYEKQNEELKSKGNVKNRVVFIGNSITEGWYNSNPGFFDNNNYVNRGISGQTTPQFLSRFRIDVVNLNPKVVVINGGINDIAQNTGTYSHDFTFGNIKSMAEIAKANGITVILTSVLPASKIPWNDKIENTAEKVIALNKDIRAYAKANKMIYVDYFSELSGEDKGMKSEFTDDGVHVTKAGYTVMENMIKKAIDKALKK